MLDSVLFWCIASLVLTSSFKVYKDKCTNGFDEASVGIAVILSEVWEGLTFPPLYPPALVSQYKLKEKYQEKIDSLDKKGLRIVLMQMAGGRQPILVSRSAVQRRILGAWFGCGEL